MNEPAYALIALTRILSHDVGTLSQNDEEADFIQQREHLAQLATAASLLAEAAYREADDLEENSVRLSQETQENLLFLLRHGRTSWEKTVADLVATEADVVREDLEARRKPEPTPEDNLKWARTVHERLDAMSREWIRDAESAVEAANQEQENAA